MENSHHKEVSFFDKLLVNFNYATSNSFYINKRHFKIGEKVICLLIASLNLENKITPALSHLEVNKNQKPSLTIYIWDSATTKTPMIDSPWEISDYNIHGKVNGFNNDRFQTGVSMVSGALSMVDLKNNIAVWWTLDANNLTLNETAEPLMGILNWWFSYNGLHFMHAGAVGRANGGALLLGIKGSGKSTSSLACIGSPLMYAGDDYCLISENETPIIYSIYNTGKLNSKSIKLLYNINFVNSYTIRYTDDKKIFFINQLFPDKIIKQYPAKAVILPTVIGRGRSSITPISSIDALKVIGPNTLFQFSGDKQRSFKAVINLVKRIPCFRLSVGFNPLEVPRLISEVI